MPDTTRQEEEVQLTAECSELGSGGEFLAHTSTLTISILSGLKGYLRSPSLGMSQGTCKWPLPCHLGLDKSLLWGSAVCYKMFSSILVSAH